MYYCVYLGVSGHARRNRRMPKILLRVSKKLIQRNMKKNFVILVLFLLIVGCDQTKNNWIKAKRTNSVAEVKKFLEENPKSQFETEAKKFIISLNWIQVKKSNSTVEVKKFLEENPNNEFENKARKLLDSLEWTPVSIDEKINMYKLIFPKDKKMSLDFLREKYNWNGNPGIYSISEKLAHFCSIGGSTDYILASKTEKDGIICSPFLENIENQGLVQISGDFGFGNLLLYNAIAIGDKDSIKFSHGTELVFKIPK